MSTPLEQAKERLRTMEGKLALATLSYEREAIEDRYSRAAATLALVSIAESLEHLVAINSQQLHNGS